MKKGILILVVMLICTQVRAQSSFEYFWPWIKSNITSNNLISTNAITNLVIYSGSSTGYVIKVSTHVWGISFPTNSAIGSNAWAWVQANSGTVNYVVAHTSVWNQAATDATYATNWIATNLLSGGASVNPRAGIWGMDHSKALNLTPYILESSAGFWKMDTNGAIVVSSNWWTDAWWSTNSSGQIVARNLP